MTEIIKTQGGQETEVEYFAILVSVNTADHFGDKSIDVENPGLFSIIAGTMPILTRTIISRPTLICFSLA